MSTPSTVARSASSRRDSGRSISPRGVLGVRSELTRRGTTRCRERPLRSTKLELGRSSDPLVPRFVSRCTGRPTRAAGQSRRIRVVTKGSTSESRTRGEHGRVPGDCSRTRRRRSEHTQEADAPSPRSSRPRGHEAVAPAREMVDEYAGTPPAVTASCGSTSPRCDLRSSLEDV